MACFDYPDRLESSETAYKNAGKQMQCPKTELESPLTRNKSQATAAAVATEKVPCANLRTPKGARSAAKFESPNCDQVFFPLYKNKWFLRLNWWVLPVTYPGVPVGVDAVCKASDEENEVGERDEECDEGDKHHPALQQRHGHIGGGHQYPNQTAK